MTYLELRNLGKRFGQTVAVDCLNLEIDEGSFVVMVGPSGCGKTTTLRMIAGLENPTSGQILLQQRDITRLAPRNRNVAMVQQHEALYPHLTVARNISFGLLCRGVERAVVNRRVEEFASLVGVAEVLQNKPAQLSGGQRQRVALARAMVREPALFLFDEPLSHLDRPLRNRLRQELFENVRRLRTTTLYVTHDKAEALALADSIVVLNQSRVEQIGPPTEVYHDPNCLFVAEFFSTEPLNRIAGTVRRRGDQSMWFETTGFSVDVSMQSQTALAGYVEQPVLAAIRAEDIQVGNGSPADRTVSIHATLHGETDLGSHWLVESQFGDREVWVARRSSAVKVAAGGAVAMSFPLQCLMFFDRTTGRRIG